MRFQSILFVSCLYAASGLSAFAGPDKTTFQTAGPWRAELDIRSDAVMVYGMNESFPERARGWRERGYTLQFMTGVAWGGYQDYLNGEFDGKNHMDEGQVQRNGEMIMHNPGVPYMVPTPSYIEYMKSLLKQAIDGGVTAIYLEEPEFWNRGGYSEGFKREWQAYYHEPWQAQHESPEATYRSAKLKYHLYFRALKELFLYAKDYSESKGQRVQCYVPTHTLISYAAWQITSPESSLADLPGMDGYIAQVWTGTARTPVVYAGVEKERAFENAYLEYASMKAMTEPTGRRVYFLTDPIEDNPNHTWEDYKLNYEATFTAQLMHPFVAQYEVMPWPDRIFLGRYQTAGSDERKPIPADYAAEILVLINTLNDMQATEDRIEGTQGVGVLLSDTMMFQRFPTHDGFEDSRMSNFYGMALPFLMRGVPVDLVQMENLLFPDTLKDIRVLVMSYANMKPLNPEYHTALMNWVKAGGYLIYLGRDNDPFQSIREWWNQDGNAFKAPSDHLFKLFDIAPAKEMVTFAFSKGQITVLRKDPKEIAFASDGGEELRALVRERLQESWIEKNHLHLRRGAYDVVAALDESTSPEPYRIKGPVIDLYDPALPVLEEKILQPNQRALLYNLSRNPKAAPCVLAASSRASDEVRDGKAYSFVMKSPSNTNGIARLLLPKEPASVKLTDAEGRELDLNLEWEPGNRTLLLQYPNSPEGVRVQVRWE